MSAAVSAIHHRRRVTAALCYPAIRGGCGVQAAWKQRRVTRVAPNRRAKRLVIATSRKRLSGVSWCWRKTGWSAAQG